MTKNKELLSFKQRTSLSFFFKFLLEIDSITRNFNLFG